MAVCTESELIIDIGKYWPSNTPVLKVYEKLLAQDKKIPLATLHAAKKGKLTTAKPTTLIRLRDLVQEWSGQDLRIEDLFVAQKLTRSHLKI